MLFDHIFYELMISKQILLLKVEHLGYFQEESETVMYEVVLGMQL